MKKKSKIVTALVLALSLMALAAVPVFAGTDSKTFGAGTIANSSASLSVSSTQATASTTNRAGQAYNSTPSYVTSTSTLP